MMEKPIVACIQHRLLISASVEEYDAHLHRFLRTAKAKGASLALFPELSGLAYAIPSFSGWRNSLLKSAGKGSVQPAGLWERTKSKLAGGAANVVRADLGQSLQEALLTMPESLRDAYISAFSNLARQYEMTLVAGSQYELDPATQEMQNVSLVFGPDGEIIGRQAKVVLGTRDYGVNQPADGWGVISTEVGRIGILLGNDVLYPEPSRILAYQGADMLLTMGAVTKPATYHKIRQAALARCQENQLYGMASFLVGPDPFAPDDAPKFVGKSAIFAPLEFTHRFTGVMVEVGSPLAEGVITAEWDYPALEELWQESDTPLRREMPLLQAGPILASVYGRALPLAENEQLMIEAAILAEAQLLDDDEILPFEQDIEDAPAEGDAVTESESDYSGQMQEEPGTSEDVDASFDEATDTASVDDNELIPDEIEGVIPPSPEPEAEELPTLSSLWPDSTMAMSGSDYDYDDAVASDAGEVEAEIDDVAIPDAVIEPDAEALTELEESDFAPPATTADIFDEQISATVLAGSEAPVESSDSIEEGDPTEAALDAMAEPETAQDEPDQETSESWGLDDSEPPDMVSQESAESGSEPQKFRCSNSRSVKH
ncbi:MAG: hypothetical protein GY759_14910 [Chloroflexi bacterium]|nr:hypothetical protein [Chloroflexota bacterium]